MSLLRVIPGAARILRSVVSIGSRHLSYRLPYDGLDGAPLYRRWLVVLALIAALLLCIALALSASDPTTGAGMVVGGLLAARFIARKRLDWW